MTEMMTAGIDTDPVENQNTLPAQPDALDEQLVGRLVEQAQSNGLQLTGDGGLLQQLTKLVVEAAMEGEITDHLGYGKHDPAGKNGGNSRNGVRPKTLLTEVGPVQIAVPRDRDGSFEPQIVRKRQRRLSGVEDMGLTTGEISAHLAEVYGADVSRQTISTITDKVMEGMAEWQNRPLDPVYPVILLDAIHVKIRDGKVANRPIYVALAVTVDGTRDILGLWAGDGGEGAKFWLHVLTELKNRGVDDVCMVVCDGLKAYPTRSPRSGPSPSPRPASSTCYGPRSATPPASTGTPSPARSNRSTTHPPNPPPWNGSASSPRHGAPSIQPSSGCGRTPGPSLCRFWPSTPRSARSCAPPTMESVNARIRRAVRARGHFPNETAALKCVYMAVMSLDPTGQGRKRWVTRWKTALNAFEITFEGRLSAGRK